MPGASRLVILPGLGRISRSSKYLKHFFIIVQSRVSEVLCHEALLGFVFIYWDQGRKFTTKQMNCTGKLKVRYRVLQNEYNTPSANKTSMFPYVKLFYWFQTHKNSSRKSYCQPRYTFSLYHTRNFKSIT